MRRVGDASTGWGGNKADTEKLKTTETGETANKNRKPSEELAETKGEAGKQ